MENGDWECAADIVGRQALAAVGDVAATIRGDVAFRLGEGDCFAGLGGKLRESGVG